jgi:hypothetical protein
VLIFGSDPLGFLFHSLIEARPSSDFCSSCVRVGLSRSAAAVRSCFLLTRCGSSPVPISPEPRRRFPIFCSGSPFASQSVRRARVCFSRFSPGARRRGAFVSLPQARRRAVFIFSRSNRAAVFCFHRFCLRTASEPPCAIFLFSCARFQRRRQTGS